MMLVTCVVILCFAGVSTNAAPIHDAAANGDLAKCKSLLDKSPKLVSAADKDGATPLHCAVAGGQQPVVELLLTKKANVNARKKDGVTPLHIAAALGRVEIAKVLIANGADVNVKDNRGGTALTFARDKGQTEIAALLEEKGAIEGVSQSNVPAAKSSGASVRDFGAKGDGKTDDTAAFQKALDKCAESGGGVVTVPTGKYLIKTHLDIPTSVTLEGTWRAPATVVNQLDPNDSKGGPELTGSVLLAVEGAGNESGIPFISLHNTATLKGITIFYPDQTKTNPPIAYPWTVASAGHTNCSVVDCLLVNPYQGVDFGTNPSGRHYIRNLYGQPLYRGIYVDNCLDVGRIENVHFWPFWTAGQTDSPDKEFMYEKGEAFIFGRSDWEFISNCFAIGYHTGMKFVEGKATGPDGGGGNYLLTQSGADVCDIAVLVERVDTRNGISFSNSQFFGDILVKDTNTGMVRFTGCGIFGRSKGNYCVETAGQGRVSFDNCSFGFITREGKPSKMIHVTSGRIAITDSMFINSSDAPYNSAPITLEPDVQAAVILGNEFYGPGTVINHAKGRVVIEHNVAQTETNPFPAK